MKNLRIGRPVIKVNVTPSTHAVYGTDVLSYRAPTRTAANRFRNSIKMLAAGGRETHLHELQYHIPMPHEFIILAGGCTQQEGVTGWVR